MSPGRCGLLSIGLAIGLALAFNAEAEEARFPEEPPETEAFVPHPEFRPYPERERLAVEGVTLIRVRRADQSEALVAREEAGWEHVVLEGFHLAFYNRARQRLRPTPGRHVIVRDWSGGAHCCFDYHVLLVHGIDVRLEGTIRAGDCELRVADLDRDGTFELIGCDARFAYGFDLPFADSPLIPLVYGFQDRAYVADSRRFPRVLAHRITEERRRLAAADRAGDWSQARRAVVSLVLHLLYAGRVTDAWCTFEARYRWADRREVREEILAGLRRAPDFEDPRLPLADVSYTLAKPRPCPATPRR